MLASSSATMFSTVPYVVSPATWSGKRCQRKSRIGWFSMTSEGVTSTLRNDAGLPTIDDVMIVVAQLERRTDPGSHQGGIRIGGTHAEVSNPAIISMVHIPLLVSVFGNPVVSAMVLISEVGWDIRMELLWGRISGCELSGRNVVG